MSGTHRFLSDSKTHTRFTPTNTYALRWLEPFVLVLNVINMRYRQEVEPVIWLITLICTPSRTLARGLNLLGIAAPEQR